LDVSIAATYLLSVQTCRMTRKGFKSKLGKRSDMRQPQKRNLSDAPADEKYSDAEDMDQAFVSLVTDAASSEEDADEKVFNIAGDEVMYRGNLNCVYNWRMMR
jgi:hypothetical protein